MIAGPRVGDIEVTSLFGDFSKLLLEVQSDVLIDVGQFDLVQQEYLGDRLQERESKSRPNGGFRPPGNEELDQW